MIMMKGKSTFTLSEAEQIEALITAKMKATSDKQKGIREKIRKFGFYASDFNLTNGYTVADFRGVVTILGNSIIFVSVKTQATKSVVVKESASPKRSTSDEVYIIDLCDDILKRKGFRQHRFDFLRGDTGVRLPVDVYYPNLNLVIEYRERQHSEEVKFFDKRITRSGISRGEQRKLYDERRRIEIPKNELILIEFDYSEFAHNTNKRLLRNPEGDTKIIAAKLITIIK
jgi:hypothetical protein